MLFVVLILLMLIVSNAKIAPAGEFHLDYNSKENSNIIKGLFVILVFCSHFSQYVTLNGFYNKPYLFLKSHMGQMVVAMFLFYSGYGIMESIIKKGFSYVKSIPCKRFLKVLLNFDIAVLLFVITQHFLGNDLDLKTILLSLIGWGTVGNSNWYIFVTLILYLLVFVSFVIIKLKQNRVTMFISLLLLSVFTIIFVYSQMLTDRPAYTYNTAILFVLGGFYSYFKPYIDKFVMKSGVTYLITCLTVAFMFFFAYNVRKKSIYAYSIWAIAFTLAVVLFTMKVSFSNPVFEWFGKRVFSIYILQRIPMLILQYFKISVNHQYEFFILSLFSTCLLAVIFDYLTEKLQRLIWKK